MRSEKIVFPNQSGQELAGTLDRPAGPPSAYAIFARCFTCSKDIAAAGRISQALAAAGIAVLRFDFTGLGSSSGDFANTNFTSNVADLVSAADFLREHHEAPQLLIGHSLGGAAVLAASRRIREVRALSTIGAPSDPAHLKHLLVGSLDTIEQEGAAPVQIAGRTFKIQRQFLHDIDQQELGEELGALRAALLVFHSPVDEVVGIEHAQRIYQAARGYKSFVSLATADHLLRNRRDAEYVAAVLAAWAGRYLADDHDNAPTVAGVRVAEIEAPYTNQVEAGPHTLLTDEPASVGGNDRGATPYDLLLASLGACTSMTLRMYADRKGWPLQHVSVDLEHSKIHAEDCAQCETDTGRVDRIERKLTVLGPELTEEQRARLLEIADRCPVHRTLEGEKEIVTTLEPGS